MEDRDMRLSGLEVRRGFDALPMMGVLSIHGWRVKPKQPWFKVAADAYSKRHRCKMRHQNDSAFQRIVDISADTVICRVFLE